jgi:hypothetical protein
MKYILNRFSNSGLAGTLLLRNIMPIIGNIDVTKAKFNGIQQ